MTTEKLVRLIAEALEQELLGYPVSEIIEIAAAANGPTIRVVDTHGNTFAINVVEV